MEKYPKPVIVVSKCLGFDSCRYNGITIQNEFVDSLKKHVRFRPVCPEVEIGLGVPRDPIRVVDDGGKLMLYQPATGRSVTKEMESFVSSYLKGLGEVDGFILKYKSPSCGIKNVRVYHSKDPGAGASKGQGFFGGEVVGRFGHLPIEDEGRLRNLSIRENFLNKAFTYARFRDVKKPVDLVEFHTRHKLLLMAYSQRQLREMGKLVACRGKADFDSTRGEYEKMLRQALSRFPRATSFINVLQHAFGGFKDKLSPKEKAFFLNTLEEYRDERIPLASLTYMLRAWALKHDNDYLLGQTFFSPFPQELMKTAEQKFRKEY